MSEQSFAALSPDRVMNATESLGYRCDARNLELNSFENRVYQIGLEDHDPVIGKFYRPNRWSDAQILEEHRFTIRLAGEDVSVVAPIEINGTTLFHFEGYRFALYPRRGGRAPNLDDLDNLEILGRHIGKLHAAGSSEPFQYRPELTVQAYAIDTRSYLLANDFIPDELMAAYSTTSEQLIELLKRRFSEAEPYTRIPLHGDCHMGNVLWRDDVPHFVDFDDARSGPAIQDLWMMLSGEREEQTLQLDAIIAGYETFADFDSREIALIEPLRTLRIMHHAAWLAKRWDDPAFPRAFPFFNSTRYWSDHILELREQTAKLQEPPLQLYPS
jgi:Ser/Thr protein kinase RdoA (MazF antagonist)